MRWSQLPRENLCQARSYLRMIGYSPLDLLNLAFEHAYLLGFSEKALSCRTLLLGDLLHGQHILRAVPDLLTSIPWKRLDLGAGPPCQLFLDQILNVLFLSRPHGRLGTQITEWIIIEFLHGLRTNRICCVRQGDLIYYGLLISVDNPV